METRHKYRMGVKSSSAESAVVDINSKLQVCGIYAIVEISDLKHRMRAADKKSIFYVFEFDLLEDPDTVFKKLDCNDIYVEPVVKS